MAFDVSSYAELDALHVLGMGASGAEFATSTGDVCEVSAHGPGVFRLRIGPRTRPDYGLVVGRAKACETTQIADGWRFTCGDSALEISGAPLRIRLSTHDRVVLTSVTDETRSGALRLPPFGRVHQAGQWVAALALVSGEPVYGLGEKFGTLDKRGQLLHSWIEPPDGVNTGSSAKNVPFAWSTGSGNGAWGVLAHTTGAVIHGIGHPDWSHRAYALVVDDEALDIFLFAGQRPSDVLRAYCELAGPAPALPPWSHGVWLGFEHADPTLCARTIVRLREHRLPVDVALLATHEGTAAAASSLARHDALHALRSRGIHIGVRESCWVPVSAPVSAELAAAGALLRTAAGEAPMVRAAALRGEDDGTEPAALVDFTAAEAVARWRELRPLARTLGAEIVETDGGEHVPADARAANRDVGTHLHNVYPLLFNRCAQGAPGAAGTERDAGRGGAMVVCARAAWTGSHRASIACGVDAQVDWEGLAASIRGALSWSMSGGVHYAMRVPAGASTAGGDLAVRWLQAALFASHVRIDLDSTSDWLYAADVEPVARKWMSFRYRLLPYLAALARTATRTGLPLMRAMPLAFPHDRLVARYDTQFMLGDALLVAPIVRPGGEMDVALPAGGWFDLNSRQRLAGPRVIRYRAAAEQMPVFGREGHVLPLAPVVQHAGEIDRARPLAQVWLFGKPTVPLEGFAQVPVMRRSEGGLHVGIAPGLTVERFGDAAEVTVEILGPSGS